MSLDEKGPAQSNLSLANGLACLQAIVSAGRPLGSREVSRLLGLEHTRVNRLLGTLAALGLASKTPERKYQPGHGIHVLAAQSLRGSGLLAAALPHLRPLLDNYLALALGVLWRKNVCYLIHCHPGRPLEEGIGTLAPYPAVKSSIGTVLLAGMSDRAIRATLCAPPDPVSQSECRCIFRQIAGVRRDGFSLIRHFDTEATLAVPVGSPAMAGLAFAGNISQAMVPGLREKLGHAAKKITAALNLQQHMPP